MTTYVLTYNPDRWTWPAEERGRAVGLTAQGHRFADRWSTGVRTSGIGPGDTAVLLRQGRGERGLIARGTFTSSVERDKHWDGSDGLANFASLDWDCVLDDADVIPLAAVMAAAPSTKWNNMQGSGVRVASPDDEGLEDLWERFGYGDRQAGGGDAQGRQNDPLRRRLVEDHAQSMLEQHFRAAGWTTEDTRYGNPFDAVATKDGLRRYLEAKGTETDGASVLVTIGEVKWARRHPGECVLGIVSNIKLEGDSVVTSSGDLSLYDWDPHSGLLSPQTFRWTPDEPSTDAPPQ